MQGSAKVCPGTHRYVIGKEFEFPEKFQIYLYCEKCGRIKRVTIKKPRNIE